MFPVSVYNAMKTRPNLLLLLLLCSMTQANQADRLVSAAMARTQNQVTYDGRYIAIPYPNGDVPKHLGVCTDVLIRSYRQLNIDLQQLVYEDMKAHFSQYPDIWGLRGTDKNIDHRRVPNLQKFFSRKGAGLEVSNNPKDYLPGDIVSWMLPGNLPHIGIVVKQKSSDGKRPLIVHNIGRGPKMDDFLFSATITGHYRFLPETTTNERTQNQGQ